MAPVASPPRLDSVLRALVLKEWQEAAGIVLGNNGMMWLDSVTNRAERVRDLCAERDRL